MTTTDSGVRMSLQKMIPWILAGLATTLALWATYGLGASSPAYGEEQKIIPGLNSISDTPGEPTFNRHTVRPDFSHHRGVRAPLNALYGGDLDLPDGGELKPASQSAPAAPANLTATPGGSGEMTLSWDDPNDATITKYQYRYSRQGPDLDWTDVPSSDATTTSVTLTGLTDGLEHFFDVRAVRGSAPGFRSAISAVPRGLLAAPANLRVNLERSRFVSLAWDFSNDASIAVYQYRYRNTSDADWNPDWTDISGSAWRTTGRSFSSLTNGVEYTFEIRAKRDDDTLGPASMITAIPRGQLLRPANLTATPGGSGEMTLSWDDPNDATITKYQYRYSRQGSSLGWTDVPSSDATTTSVTLTGLTDGLEHFFDVRAVRGSAPGFRSTISAVPRGLLAAPANLRVNLEGSRFVRLAWDSSNDASIAVYQYRYRNTSDADWNPDWTDISGSIWRTTVRSFSSLTNGVEYTFEIRAKRDDDTLGPASMITAIPRGQLLRPANLTATPGGSGEMTLSWDDPNDATITKYQYRYSRQGPDLDWTDVPSSDATTTSVTLTGLTDGLEHFFDVRAMRGSAPGFRSTISAVPRGLLAAPANLRVNLEGSRFVRLAWDSSNDASIAVYQYRYHNTSDADWNPDWTDISGSIWRTTVRSFSSLTNGVEYTFEIRAKRDDDTLGPASMITAIPRGPLLKPANLRVAPAGGGEMTLSWDDPNDATITKYQYRYSRQGSDLDWTDVPSSDATTTSVTLTGLTVGLPHRFYVRPVRGTVRVLSSRSDGTPLSPLPAPGNITAMAGDRQVTLSWDDPNEASIAGYQYRHRPTSSSAWDPDWTHVPNSSATTTSYIVTGLTNGLEYTFEVRATRGGAGGPTSSGTATPSGPLRAPADLTATPAGAGEIILRWDGGQDVTITKYQYRHRIGSGAWDPDWTDIPNSGATTTSHTLTGLTAATTYRFEVRAARGATNGPESHIDAAPLGLLPAPANFAATSGDDRQSTLSWDDPNEASIAGYQYRHRPTSFTAWDPDWTDIPNSSATTTSYTVTGLTNGLEYTFEVRATRGGTGGPASSSAGTPGGVLRAVENLRAAPAGDGEITLRWDDARDATITRYQYRHRIGEGAWNPDWTDIPNSGPTTTSHTLTGLTNNIEHTFEVRSKRDMLEGPESRTTGTPRLPLAAPTSFVATSGDDRRSTLSWENPNDRTVDGYQYRYRVSSQSAWNPDWTLIAGSRWNTTSYTVSNLANQTEYTFEVRAFRDGLGGPASTATAMPEGPPTVPQQPGFLSVGGGDRRLSALWSRPDGADIRAPVTSYRVRYREVGSSSWNNVSRASDDLSRTQEITGLKDLTQYEVQVAAVNIVGTGPWSSARATTQPPDDPPDDRTGDSALRVPGAVYVYWTASSGSREPHPNGEENRLTLESCHGTHGFRAIWSPPPGQTSADEWEAFIHPKGDITGVTHSISSDSRGNPELNGTVTMVDPARLSVRVRGRFGTDWGTWSRTTTFGCEESD